MALRPIGVALVLTVLLAPPSSAWNNGQSGNSNTGTAAECDHPPYATHDWIADRALALLPDQEAWLLPLKSVYLLGTEAPDFKGIPTACQTPNHGYDDRNQGHSVEWAANWSKMTKDRAATRAQEEYNKAALAYRQGNPRAAAFYLGAMAHYIGDVSQYGHTIPSETHHSDYEGWVAQRRASFSGGTFETYISSEPRVRRSAYVAAKRISLTVARGKAPSCRRSRWIVCGRRSRSPTSTASGTRSIWASTSWLMCSIRSSPMWSTKRTRTRGGRRMAARPLSRS
jgi:hypothetical protein